jgi:hypothetical protein
MIKEIKDTVGMQECVTRIEEHFRRCKEERDILYAEDVVREFKDAWSTLVEALLCPAEERTPYQALIVEDTEEVMRKR